MLRLTFQRKVFLALAALLVALLLIFVGLSRFGLQRNLGAYVAEIELSRMDWLARRLEQIYAEKGSWEALRSDPNAWHAAQMHDAAGGRHGPGAGTRPPGGPPGFAYWSPRGGAGGPGGPGGRPGEGPGDSAMRPAPQLDVLPERYAPPPPPDDAGDPRARSDLVYARLGLLDASARTQIAGPTLALQSVVKMPLSHDGVTVGWLAIAPLQSAQGAADRAFVAQQSRFVAFSGIAGLALALLISWWLARRWLAPVRQLVHAAQEVAQGRLQTQVPVRGSDEIAVLSQTFNAMALRLHDAAHSRERWLADVAHELRTPLAAMRAEIEALQDGVRSFDVHTAGRLHGQVMRLGQLVDDLRQSMDAGQSQPLQLTPMQPVDVLLEAATLVGERFAQARIALGTAGLQALAGTQGPRVHGDAARLHQVFANLFENTLRYTHAGGRLALAARIDRSTNDAALVLTFDDTEPAPTPQEMPSLFDRFYRAEVSRSRAHGGSGLGLAICKALVQAHGGRIAAQASPLGGLRISVSLPLSS